jgi:hypothetical protein
MFHSPAGRSRRDEARRRLGRSHVGLVQALQERPQGRELAGDERAALRIDFEAAVGSDPENIFRRRNSLTLSEESACGRLSRRLYRI